MKRNNERMNNVKVKKNRPSLTKVNYKKLSKMSAMFLVGAFLLMGCGKATQDAADEPSTEQSNTDQTDSDLTNTSPKLDENTAKAMQFDKQIEGIKSITLNDLEGNVVERTFTPEETTEIQQAFNDSFIMDTAYIEMIGGNTMTILLDDGRSVFIHSYGDENYIVARIGEGETYHLGCALIAKILLEQ